MPRTTVISKKSHRFSFLSPTLAVVILIPLFLIALLVGIFAYSQKFEDTSRNQDTPMPPGKQTEIDNPQKDPAAPAANGDKDTTPGASPSQSAGKVEISNAYQDQSSNLVVKTSIHAITTGTCKLEVTFSDGQTMTKDADVLFQPEFSTCTGFAIDKSELAAIGNAKLHVGIFQDGMQMAETTREITLK